MKTDLLKELYAGTKQLFIRTNNPDDKDASLDKLYHVVLVGRDGMPDCKVSNVVPKNFYFRTANAKNRKQYTTYSNLKRAIKSACKKNLEYGVVTEIIVNDVSAPNNYCSL